MLVSIALVALVSLCVNKQIDVFLFYRVVGLTTFGSHSLVLWLNSIFLPDNEACLFTGEGSLAPSSCKWPCRKRK